MHITVGAKTIDRRSEFHCIVIIMGIPVCLAKRLLWPRYGRPERGEVGQFEARVVPHLLLAATREISARRSGVRLRFLALPPLEANSAAAFFPSSTASTT
jgi:hypothetical protein